MTFEKCDGIHIKQKWNKSLVSCYLDVFTLLSASWSFKISGLSIILSLNSQFWVVLIGESLIGGE